MYAGGEYAYSFLFSGKLDSTCPDSSTCNEEIVGWEIVKAQVGVCATSSMDEMPKIDTMQSISFDGVPLLEDGEGTGKAKYGGHPNEEGCRVWAEALYQAVKARL